MKRWTIPARSGRWAVGAVLACIAAPVLGQDLEPAQTSRLTGVALPPGAQRVLNKEVAAQAVKSLEALAKQLGKTCDNPEVLLWVGAGKPASADAIQEVSGRLEKAGFRCLELDAPEGMPAVVKKIVAAVGAKQAVLGFWAASDDLLTLAWCRAGAGQAAVPGEPAAAGDHLPPFPKLTVKPGFIVGTALKMSGKPLVGADITLTGTTLAGRRTSLTAPTDDKGHYELPLPPGVYRLAMGTWRVRYDGRTYRLPLRTESGDADTVVASKGAVGNWVLQVSGPVPDSDLFYGGRVVASIEGSRAPRDVGWREGTVVEVTLTPQGPLVDGSTGRPVQARYTVPSQGGNSAFLSSILFTMPGVPIGRYAVSARVLDPGGGARPLAVTLDVHRPAIGDDSFPASARPLYFQPAEAGGQGVDGAEIYLLP